MGPADGLVAGTETVWAYGTRCPLVEPSLCCTGTASCVLRLRLLSVLHLIHLSKDQQLVDPYFFHILIISMLLSLGSHYKRLIT